MSLSPADHARIAVRHPDPDAAITMFQDMPEGTLEAQVAAGQEFIEGMLGDVDDDAILAAIADGRLQTAAPPPPPPPPSLPDLEPYQFHAMLKMANVKDAVEAAIAAMDQPGAMVAQERYARSVRFRRDDPMFADLGPAVGLSSSEIDALWAWAATL